MTGEPRRHETYTHGHAPAVIRQHAQRAAAAALLLPELRPLECSDASRADLEAMAAAFRAPAVHPDALWVFTQVAVLGRKA